MQTSEPGNVINKKICGNLVSNVWDLWEININKEKREENCVKFLFDELKKKYKIFPKDIFLGKRPIYLSMKNKENKNSENQKLTDLFEINDDNQYLDVIITFTEKEESKEFLKNIPRIRIHFK